MTPEKYASEYLEKHGLIPLHNFVPSTALDKAAKLYTDFADEDLVQNLVSDAEYSNPDLPHLDWFGEKI